MDRESTNGKQDQLVEEVKEADLDDKLKIFQEALQIAHENGNAEELLGALVRNAAPGAKQAAATEAITSDKEVAKQTLSETMDQVPLEVKKAAVKEAVDNTDSQRAARELIVAAMNPAPEATKDAVAKAVKGADTDEEAQEILAQAIHAAPAGTAEAAIRDARLTPETLDVIWRTIVKTFSWVLGGATFGLVVIIILNIPFTVELAHVQIMLTMFTTVAGILAGFITGQAVGTAQERGRGAG